jgi:hypothetical protein
MTRTFDRYNSFRFRRSRRENATLSGGIRPIHEWNWFVVAGDGGKVTFIGADPIYESRFRIAACISIPIMAGAAGAAIVWRMRTGRGQDLSLDLRKAIHGVNPVYKFKPTINGYAYQMPFGVGNNTIFDLYLTKDGRWVLPTGGYPHMLAEWCSLLRCSPDKASIANTIFRDPHDPQAHFDIHCLFYEPHHALVVLRCVQRSERSQRDRRHERRKLLQLPKVFANGKPRTIPLRAHFGIVIGIRFAPSRHRYPGIVGPEE